MSFKKIKMLVQVVLVSCLKFEHIFQENKILDCKMMRINGIVRIALCLLYIVCEGSRLFLITRNINRFWNKSKIALPRSYCLNIVVLFGFGYADSKCWSLLLIYLILTIKTLYSVQCWCFKMILWYSLMEPLFEFDNVRCILLKLLATYFEMFCDNLVFQSIH